MYHCVGHDEVVDKFERFESAIKNNRNLSKSVVNS